MALNLPGLPNLTGLQEQYSMDLSIIIVNYKTPGLVMDCLGGLFQNTSGINFEVILVDNDSHDGVEMIVQGGFPQVKFVQMGYNAGFARANNEGIRHASGEAVLLLNSDTIVEDNAISNCFTNLQRSTYVACGVQLLNPDRTPQMSGFYSVKGGLNFLLALPYAGAIVKFIGNLLKLKKPNVPKAAALTEVDWINGAFLMVKRSAFEKAGLMNEDFFLYSEEVEWCSRLRKIGKLCIYGDLHINHLLAGSSMATFDSSDKTYDNIFDKKGQQLMVSNFLRIRKEWGAGWFLFMLFLFILEIPFFLILHLLSHLFFLPNRYPFKTFGGYVRNVGKVVELSPRILSNKAWFYKML